jgi:hypothetical protein
VAACFAATAAARAEVVVKLEAGTELDSNVHRVTTERGADEPAAGARVGARMAGGFRLGERAALRLSALAAGKVYPVGRAAAQENVGVVAGDARFDVAIGDVAPGVRVAYYDASVAALSTDGSLDHHFRTGEAAATLTLRAGDHRVEASAGGRFFDYKPRDEFDFTGAVFGLAIGRRLRSEDATWELAYSGSYTASQRAYVGDVLVNSCEDGEPIVPDCLDPAPLSRADLFHDLALEATFTRDFILSGRYVLQLNDSNSFGQSLLRHRLELTATSELFWEIFGSARAVLVVNQFLDALLLSGDVGTFVTIEDEARNAVILHLTREASRWLAFEARYAFYANPFARSSLEYRRHTLYLGLVYTFRR